ncbi:hypothetical protein PSPO01_15340 [Paraphaeosphaeria sporulosa]
MARKSITHVGGLVFHTFVTLGWTLGWIYTLGTIWKNDIKSSGSVQSSGWEQSRLGRLIEYFRGGARQGKEHPEIWTIAYCTIVYLIVTGGGLACLFVEDELWALLCENLSECLVFPVLTRLILSESSEEKDTEKEDSRSRDSAQHLVELNIYEHKVSEESNRITATTSAATVSEKLERYPPSLRAP